MTSKLNGNYHRLMNDETRETPYATLVPRLAACLENGFKAAGVACSTKAGVLPRDEDYLLLRIAGASVGISFSGPAGDPKLATFAFKTGLSGCLEAVDPRPGKKENGGMHGFEIEE